MREINKLIFYLFLSSTMTGTSIAQTNTRCYQDITGAINCRTSNTNILDPLGDSGDLSIPQTPQIDPIENIRRMQQSQQLHLQNQRLELENAIRLRQLEAAAPEWQTSYFQSSNKKYCTYSHPSGFFIAGHFRTNFSTELPPDKKCPPILEVSKSNKARIPPR